MEAARGALSAAPKLPCLTRKLAALYRMPVPIQLEHRASTRPASARRSADGARGRALAKHERHVPSGARRRPEWFISESSCGCQSASSGACEWPTAREPSRRQKPTHLNPRSSPHYSLRHFDCTFSTENHRVSAHRDDGSRRGRGMEISLVGRHPARTLRKTGMYGYGFVADAGAT